MTTNQVNEGYGWDSYKQAVLSGIEMLDKAHPTGIANLPRVGAELKYQDGFIFEENETAAEFMQKKLNLGFSVPQHFFAAAELPSPQVTGHNIGFEIKLQKPSGSLVVSLIQALLNKKPGFVMETSVRSTEDSCPEFDTGKMGTWLEQAHNVQKLAFESFINSTYMKSFK